MVWDKKKIYIFTKNNMLTYSDIVIPFETQEFIL